MKEEWLFPGAVVPVDVDTTAALVAEIKRLIGVVGGMALDKQRQWVGLTDEEFRSIANNAARGGLWEPKPTNVAVAAVHAASAKLKEKNT